MKSSTRIILLTGATGFVGRALAPRLLSTGWQVRCLTRNAARARAALPERQWVQGDLGSADDCARALDGCSTAMYLVHGMGEGSDDYQRREIEGARRFARAAGTAGVKRIVYLGGISPAGEPSPHLRSRLAVGQELRNGPVPTVELRASMIIGHGSLSWLIVRDLAARLPVMVLPSWLRSRSEPVAIADVLTALVAATDAPMVARNASFDLPGPDVLSGHEILDETARQMKLRRPLAIEVPLLSPRLSSHWVRFVTRAKWTVAREVVMGLTHDLVSRDAAYWRLIGHDDRLSFGEAARLALAAERASGPPSGPWGLIERLIKRTLARQAG